MGLHGASSFTTVRGLASCKYGLPLGCDLAMLILYVATETSRVMQVAMMTLDHILHAPFVVPGAV